MLLRELEGIDWKEREKAELKRPSPDFAEKAISSPMGGGVVSVELRPSRSSEIPDAVGEVDDRSESCVSGFIFTKTVAASRSWTCWCLEMSSFEVTAHAGSCSHLHDMSTLANSDDYMKRCCGTPQEYTHMCFVRQLLCLYPFPQRSHLSSVADRFPSPLMRCEPSLARRLRCLMLMGLVVVDAPSTAVLLGEFFRSAPLRPMYDPKFDEAPTEAASAPRRELSPLRWAVVAGLVPSCPVSLSTAAVAAAAAALLAALDFLRVTLWFTLTAPREMEWEWCRPDRGFEAVRPIGRESWQRTAGQRQFRRTANSNT